MKQIWNEYGLIAILLVIAVGGYLSLGDQKEDFLSDPLDAIGARFTALMRDDASREQFSETYTKFRQRALDREITPDQLESVAASVLNLQASGATLSPEEGEMVLALASESSPRAFPVPKLERTEQPVPPSSPEDSTINRYRVREITGVSPAREVPDVSPDRYRAMSDRVSDVFLFADEVHAIASKGDVDISSLPHVQYVFDNGIAVVVDSGATLAWNNIDLLPITRDLERKRLVHFRKGVGESAIMRGRALEAERELYIKARSLPNESRVEDSILESMERFNKLQQMGMVVAFDTLAMRRQINDNILAVQEMLRNAGIDTDSTSVRIEMKAN